MATTPPVHAARGHDHDHDHDHFSTSVLAPEHVRLLRQMRVDLQEGKSIPAELAHLDGIALETIYAHGYDAWQAGDMAEAANSFDFLTRYQPAEYRYRFAYACALQQQGKLHGALESFGMAAALGQSEPVAVFHCAQCHKALGEIEQARSALNQVLILCHVESGIAERDALRERAEQLLRHLQR